ncbi:MAG: hypothetical protein JSW08_02885 [archaeon]|nr:MAG: hypothetical protein JSW08_02885 [archaeon]
MVVLETLLTLLQIYPSQPDIDIEKRVIEELRPVKKSEFVVDSRFGLTTDGYRCGILRLEPEKWDLGFKYEGDVGSFYDGGNADFSAELRSKGEAQYSAVLGTHTEDSKTNFRGRVGFSKEKKLKDPELPYFLTDQNLTLGMFGGLQTTPEGIENSFLAGVSYNNILHGVPACGGFVWRTDESPKMRIYGGVKPDDYSISFFSEDKNLGTVVAKKADPDTTKREPVAFKLEGSYNTENDDWNFSPAFAFGIPNDGMDDQEGYIRDIRFGMKGDNFMGNHPFRSGPPRAADRVDEGFGIQADFSGNDEGIFTSLSGSYKWSLDRGYLAAGATIDADNPNDDSWTVTPKLDFDFFVPEGIPLVGGFMGYSVIRLGEDLGFLLKFARRTRL